jgi:hypothetical protein
MTEADGSFSIFPIYCQRETLSKTNIQLIKKMNGVSLSLDIIDLYVSFGCAMYRKKMYSIELERKKKKDTEIYTLCTSWKMPFGCAVLCWNIITWAPPTRVST